jgi:hypothetical protein
VAPGSLHASDQLGSNADSFGLYPIYTTVVRHGTRFCACQSPCLLLVCQYTLSIHILGSIIKLLSESLLDFKLRLRLLISLDLLEAMGLTSVALIPLMNRYFRPASSQLLENTGDIPSKSASTSPLRGFDFDPNATPPASYRIQIPACHQFSPRERHITHTNIPRPALSSVSDITRKMSTYANLPITTISHAQRVMKT